MRAGDLRHVVAIQERTQASDGMGGFSDTWADVTGAAKVPAGVWPLRANEIVSNDKLELQITHRIIMRHPKVAITADMRIRKYDYVAAAYVTYNIVSILNSDDRDIRLELLAKKVT